MKNLFNNMSEQEKKSILEQHKGGMNVMSENFFKLLGSKLGDVKPLSEQKFGSPEPTMAGGKMDNQMEAQMPNVKKGQSFNVNRSTDNQVYVLTIDNVQPRYITAKIKGPGKYEGKPLDGTGSFELTWDGMNYGFRGNQEMGLFRINKDKRIG
jgi:hypothetical protein